MYTSVGLLALAHALTAAAVPSWHTSYGTAQEKAVQEKRPLVVVVSSGQDGFNKICKDGKLNGEASALLAQHYVCVYLDLSNPQQAALARQLAIATGQGIVISDRSGGLQAFHHDGTLSQDDLARQLRHFANPALEVRTTTTNGASRISFYPEGTSGGATSIRNC